MIGKASFCNILDWSGNIQSYVARDSVERIHIKTSEIGYEWEISWNEGEVFKTKTGEISIHASTVNLLAKSLPDSSGERMAA